MRGKVRINKTGQRNDNLILKPNQRAVYSKTSNALNVDQVSTDRLTCWRLEKLIFYETPFLTFLNELSGNR